MHKINKEATWYEGEGRLLAQWLFGCVFPLTQLENGWPETYHDLLKVATLLNKHLSQERIVALIDIIADSIRASSTKVEKKTKKRGKK